MLHLNDVTLRVAGRPLLEAANLHVPAGQRTALVGRNGTGKTTLLRLIAGELQPDAGSLRLRSGVRIGVVAQEAPGGPLSPLEAVLAADRERTALLAEAATSTDPARLGEVHARLEVLGAAAAPARAATILSGLGFDEAAQGRPLASFSGGWRMRVALAAVLFLEPDLLLLDEPTNHLDLEAALWLEGHLARYPRTMILISHDRDLLNSVPQRTVHLEARKLTTYAGGYDAFEAARAERRRLTEKTRAKQDAARSHMQSFVDRFRYKASKARQAQSRLKMLERMAVTASPPPEPEVVFAFPPATVPAPPLITMEAASAGYGERVVLDRLELRIDPDDRLALLGANGNGKSTFAKLVAGRLEALSGTVTRARGLRVGFFAQHQIEDLIAGENAIQHVARALPQERPEATRARLARFGLGAEKAGTPAMHLSGGEKTRLALCLMCLGAPQLLILDEPTNHLDIDSRAALVDAINEFPGAVILVSHDRHLVELVADGLWLVAGGRVRPYEGDLDDYRRLLLDTSATGPNGGGGKRTVSAAERRSRTARLRKEAKAAERQVETLTRERATLEERLADPAFYMKGGDVADLQRRLANLSSRLTVAEASWLEAEGRIEEVEAA